MQALYDSHKEQAGRWATYTWIGSGLYLFIVHGGLASIFSMKGLLFFVGGMFTAALILGAVFYVTQRAIAKALWVTTSEDIRNDLIAGTATPRLVAHARKMKTVGLVLMAVQTLLVFLVARWAYFELI